MATMTFDKLAYVDRLKAAGFEDDKARAMAESLDVALREEIVTKSELERQLSDIRSPLRLHNWMLTFNLGLSVLVVGKLFLSH